MALLPLAAQAEGPAPVETARPLTLSLAEALELAVQGHGVRQARLVLDETDTQVEQARGAVFPRVDASLRYTRTFDTPNPFAGSSAGSIFGGLGQVGWLDYNERARTDTDPATAPLTLEEYLRRQSAGLDEAGIDGGGGDNPFLVENELVASLSVSQVLYNGAAFAALDGARAVRDQVSMGIEVAAQRAVEETARAYLGTLLANARVAVLQASVQRVQDTLEDTRRLVAQGVVARYQQLAAEVELANLETALIQAQDAARGAEEALGIALGLDVGRPLVLTDALALAIAMKPPQIDPAQARAQALQKRPDLQQLRLAERTRALQTEVARAAFRPVVSAFFNLSYLGRVPDDRTTTVADPQVPFQYSKEEAGLFDDAYWGPNITAGLSLTWNLFSGFEDQARVAQSDIAGRRLADQRAELERVVAVEVDQAVRALLTADDRIRTQEKNLARADLNYEHARARVKEGVSTQLELRSASQQLDETRFNHLQAVHDYLVAFTRYQVAVGERPGADVPIVPTREPPLPPGHAPVSHAGENP